MAKRPAAKTTAKAEPVRTVTSTDKTAEAKRTTRAKQDAAAKQFADADAAIMAGRHPDTTVEQHENLIRKAALGY